MYPSVGSVSNGETVTALWKEGSFVFIEYLVTGTSQKKRGYVNNTTITVTESVSTKSFSPTSKTVSSNATTYTGPNTTTYPSAGSVSSGETVSALTTDGSFTFIEYSITGTSQKKRAYVASSALSTPSSGGGTPTVGAMATTFTSSYYSSGSPFYPDYVGECTWYCWGRAKEYKNTITLPTSGAGAWYGQTSFTKLADPVKNSIACWSTGHVAYVEAVVSGTVYFSEANWYTDGRKGNGQYETPYTNPVGTDGVIQSASIAAFKARKSGYQGCIKLPE
jgi:surface antigen